MTVNQKGRTERIFVNLEAIYPTPDLLGTELSVEEIRAGHRGWLSKIWQPETFLKPSAIESTASRNGMENPRTIVDDISGQMPAKLVILRDPINLDENGIAREPAREGKGRRMKIKEVNETQISK